MKQIQQGVDEILTALSPLPADWKDRLAENVIDALAEMRATRPVTQVDLELLLSRDFDVGMTVVRLFLDRSKDEFEHMLRAVFAAEKTHGQGLFTKDPTAYVERLCETGVLLAANQLIGTPISWKELLTERLKSGRGSAIKGQHRGRALGDFVERIVQKVFGSGNYDVRCSFVGKDGVSTAKSDFAIPSKERPEALIEVKAFGATGSKQTNILGDVNDIIREKRHDTVLLLVTDGVTWSSRKSDLKKLVTHQNHGDIYRIYTMKMEPDLQDDLRQLQSEKSL